MRAVLGIDGGGLQMVEGVGIMLRAKRISVAFLRGFLFRFLVLLGPLRLGCSGGAFVLLSFSGFCWLVGGWVS